MFQGSERIIISPGIKPEMIELGKADCPFGRGRKRTLRRMQGMEGRGSGEG